MEFYQLDDGSIVTSLTGSMDEGQRLVANTQDASKEKHVPDVTIDGQNITVKIGSIEHPMTEEHYIMFVAVETNNKTYIKEFNPGNKPVAHFIISPDDEVVAVYEYCSLHGLWVA